MGIIAEKPVNPYEIKKLLDTIKTNKWLSMSASSIYVAIRKLKEKGCISGEAVREGNMPEKTIYSITEHGRKTLYDSLTDLISSMELDSRKYHIFTLMICHMKKDEAIELLRKKVLMLERAAAYTGKAVESFNNVKAIPYVALAGVKHELRVIRAEISSVKELLEDIGSDPNWDYFLTRDLGSL